VVALRVSPVVEGHTRLVFRVYEVTIVDTSFRSAPARVLPVSYDPGRNQFTIQTVPPVEEPQMAEFFLARAEHLLDDLHKRHVTGRSR
jgi:hypothetical protein